MVEDGQAEGFAEKARSHSLSLIDSAYDDGMTLLHIAVKETVDLIVEIEDLRSHSRAVSQEKIRRLKSQTIILQALVKTGANQRTRDREGKTPRDYAVAVVGEVTSDPIGSLIIRANHVTVAKVTYKVRKRRVVLKSVRKQNRRLALASGGFEMEESERRERVKV